VGGKGEHIKFKYCAVSCCELLSGPFLVALPVLWLFV